MTSIKYDAPLVAAIAAVLWTSTALAADLEPLLGAKGRLLLEEQFEAESLPTGWAVKSGSVKVAGGTLLASQDKEAGRLCLFSCEQPVQDAAIQIDFKFDGARGINISANPSPGALTKRGHLYSVMITPVMWRITEHNDKSDRQSQSKTLASAAERFESGQWYTLLVETKGDSIAAQINGKQPLRATSPDFHVKKPGIEFRVLGPTMAEVCFDNLRVWELKEQLAR